MRWLATAIFVLTATVSVVNANVLTLTDARAAKSISDTLLSAAKDMVAARKGLMETNDQSANGLCIEHIQNYLMVIQSHAFHLSLLLLLSAQMADPDDEASVLKMTRLATDQLLGEGQIARSEINHLSGVCSRLPLAVAKALQSIELIDRATTFANSISKRLSELN